jgi:hypothetical protein
VEVEVGIVVAVEVGGMGVCVEVSEGAGGVTVSIGGVDPGESKQPTSSGNSHEHITRSLDKKYLLEFIVLGMDISLRRLYRAPPSLNQYLSQLHMDLGEVWCA